MRDTDSLQEMKIGIDINLKIGSELVNQGSYNSFKGL